MNPSTRATTVVTVFLGLHVLFVWWRPISLWGMDLLAQGPAWGWILFLTASAVLVVPRSRRTLHPFLNRLGDAVSRHRVLPPLILVLVSVALFIAFRSATHLLGDGYLYIRELDTGIWELGQRTDRAPLTFFLIRQLHGLGWWQDAETTYRVYSMTAGVLFVTGATVIARKIAPERLHVVVLAGALLTSGLVQVFFGYVENYALPMAGLLAYLYAGFTSMQSRNAPWISAIVLGVLLPLHFAYLFMLPSVFLLAFLCSRSDQPVRHLGTWMNAIGVTLGAMALGTAILLAIGFDPVAFFTRNQGSHLLPLLEEPSYRQHYRLFSPLHGLDLLNLVLLVAPAAVLTVFITGRSRPDRYSVFLLATAAMGFGFSFLANPEIGIFRDWDVLSFGAVPLVLAAGIALVQTAPDSRQLSEAGILVIGASLLHTAAWVGVNSDTDRSMTRFARVLETAPLSDHALSYGWESLGSLYFKLDRSGEAEEAYQKAAGATSKNPRHWLSLGAIALKAGDHDKAMQHYQTALEMSPDRGEVHRRLGELYLRKNDLANAELRLNRALELSPLDVTVHVLMGSLHMGKRDYAQARESYQQALALNPRSLEASSNLAAAYYGEGKFQEAIASAEQALKLRPDHGNTLYVLGASHLRLNQQEKAESYLRRFLEVDPGNARAPQVRRLLGL